jgi:hypothetical protein
MKRFIQVEGKQSFDSMDTFKLKLVPEAFTSSSSDFWYKTETIFQIVIYPSKPSQRRKEKSESTSGFRSYKSTPCPSAVSVLQLTSGVSARVKADVFSPRLLASSSCCLPII